MGVGLSGRLEDFGIADVFQLIGQQRKTGVLELKDSSTRVQLVFDNGLVVSASNMSGRATDPDPLATKLVSCGLLTRERAEEAEAACRNSAQTIAQSVVERGWLNTEQVHRIEDLLTRDTIFDILRWKRGSFDFRAQQVTHDKNPNALLGAEQILMDGLRMVDEWNSIRKYVSSGDTVFQRVGRIETYRKQAQDAPPSQIEQAEAIFALLDGRLPIQRVIDLSQLGKFEGMRAVADLRRAEVIKELDPAGVRELRKHIRPPGSTAAAVRRWAGAAVPVVLLCLAALLTRPEAPAPTPPDRGVFAIEPTVLEHAREAYATRRLRNAMEAYRLLEGRWPSRLADLESRGLVEPDALAAPAGRPYYSLHREGGFVVLAPER
ncbi:MAG TPA: DUF4388 domain-containing protein [Myxococcota bacterium]